MVFDPPFIFSKGIQRVIGTKRFFLGAEHVEVDGRTHSKAIIRKPKNPTELLEHYRCIFQQHNIARHGLILKGQDLIVNAPDYWMYNVMNLAEEMGLGMPADYLLQYSSASRMKDPRWKQQKHFRRAHCIYLIYKWE